MKVGIWVGSTKLMSGTYQKGDGVNAVVSSTPLPKSAVDWKGKSVEILRGNNVMETSGTVAGVDLKSSTVYVQ